MIETSGVITTHFDYSALEDNLVKLDILGHDDPTILRMLGDMTGVDVHSIPLDDPDTMAIFSRLDTLGVDAEDVGSYTSAPLGCRSSAPVSFGKC